MVVKAKNHFDSQEYKHAIDVILQIINCGEYQNNDKLYYKLGEIYTILEEYTIAIEYYQQSLKLNDKNPNTYLKLGKLEHYHLNNYQQSKQMYEECLRLNNQHISCIFHLGKLMLLFNKFSEAETLFKKCLKIDSTKASLHYYLAIVLDKQHKINNQDNILYSLHKAMDLQPTIAKYHIEFAIYSEKIKKNHQANHSYKTVLMMINYSDPLLLAKYSYFLINSMNDNKNALKYLKKAYKLDAIYKDDYDILNERISMQKQHKYSIKLIVFDFETIILYREPKQLMDNLNVSDLKAIFGGNDRIIKLKEILQKGKDKNVKNIIFSTYKSNDTIYKSLKSLGLYKYIENIIGKNDISHFYTENKNKIYRIIKIKDDYSLNSSDEILYISGNLDDIVNVSDECKTYFVNSKNSYPFSGPNLYDFNQLNHIIDNPRYVIQNNVNHKFKYDESTSILKRLNEDLLNRLTNEIINNVKYNRPIKSMDDIHELQRIDSEYLRFIEFCDIFKTALVWYKNGNWWSAGYYLQRILQTEQSQFEIWMRFAKCCSYLKHIDAANAAYFIALRINPEHYDTNFSYSYHLLMCGYYKESKEQFIVTKNLSKFNVMNASLLVGLARSSEELREFDEAEKYYKNASNNSKIRYYEPAHYYYGCFLEKHERLSEAMEQFEICFNKSPNKFQNLLKICDISWKLNDSEKFEFFMKKALKIDQSVIYNYERYYKKSHIIYTVENSNYIVNDQDIINSNVNHDAEFDSFWFDEISITIPKFNQYYDNFIKNNLNHMNLLLNDRKLAKTLTEIIQIKDQIHFDLIISKICNFNRKDL